MDETFQSEFRRVEVHRDADPVEQTADQILASWPVQWTPHVAQFGAMCNYCNFQLWCTVDDPEATFRQQISREGWINCLVRGKKLVICSHCLDDMFLGVLSCYRYDGFSEAELYAVYWKILVTQLGEIYGR